MKKILIIYSILLLLNSCSFLGVLTADLIITVAASPRYPSEYSKRKESKIQEINNPGFNKENSIIITSFKSRLKLSGFKDLNELRVLKLGLININNDSEIFVTRRVGTDLVDYYLEHGKYYIATLQISNKQPWWRHTPPFHSTKSGLDKNNKPSILSFEAKKGEIVYIGDLNFNVTVRNRWTGKAKLEIEVKDNYDEAVRRFRVEHPEFKNRSVTKRLARTGTMLKGQDIGRL